MAPSHSSMPKFYESPFRDVEPSCSTPPHYESADTSRIYTLSSSRSLDLGRSRLSSWTKKAAERVPAPVMRCARTTVAWVKGPPTPSVYKIEPIFESIQTFPKRLFGRLPSFARWAILFAAFMLWVVLFGVTLADYSLPNDIGGIGAPMRLACTTRLWPSPEACGLDGRTCFPFSNSSFAFSCPASCASTMVLNPYTIGENQIVYQTVVVGGTPPSQPIYRGDSFICAAAIQAGIITDKRGGCGVVSLIGEHGSYGSDYRNGIPSVPFDSSFPMSFRFDQSEPIARTAAQCKDPRWNLLTLSTIMTAFFTIFTYTASSFFAVIFTIAFFQIAMASDPPYFSNYPSLASTAVGNFLPAALIAALIYRFCIRKTLAHLTAQLEKTILWVGGLWVGALSNLTFEQIPIQRLHLHDIQQQPGGVIALVIIVIVLFFVVLYQAWCFRNEGRLPRYLGLYCLLGIGLLILLAIPEQNLRLHHYIIALLLLPGTALQTRPSLLYQGLLIGLFINGVARWSFAPILETSAALRGDAFLGAVSPFMHLPAVSTSLGSPNITFMWNELPRGWEGVSILINDVERFRGFGQDAGGENRTVFTWERNELDRRSGSPEYFRFGFLRYYPFGAVGYSDFTRAGIWWANSSWVDPPPGLS